MNTQDSILVQLLNIKSTSTSTGVPTAVDMAPYFPVMRRSVKFVVGYVAGTTASGDEVVTITIEECASTATASFTSVLGPDGSTGTWTSTASGSTVFEWHGNLNYRYIRAKVVSAGTNPKNVASVFALLPKRAA